MRFSASKTPPTASRIYNHFYAFWILFFYFLFAARPVNDDIKSQDRASDIVRNKLNIHLVANNHKWKPNKGIYYSSLITMNICGRFKWVRLSRRSSNQCSLWQFVVGFCFFRRLLSVSIRLCGTTNRSINYCFLPRWSFIKIRFDGIRFVFTALTSTFAYYIFHFLESSDAWTQANQSNDREQIFREKNDEDKVGAFACIHALAHRHRHRAFRMDMAFCTIPMFCVLWLTFCCAFKFANIRLSDLRAHDH